jgi:NAD(P)-dependent dehydrogenase (short-subunit alcohol dehydrogenase family)
MEVAGKVAIVTGAGAEGTGRAVALALAERKASVVVTDLDAEGGTETVERVEGRGGRAAFDWADVRVADDIRAMVTFAEERFGGLDILINNAGNTWPPHFPDCPPSTGRLRSP